MLTGCQGLAFNETNPSASSGSNPLEACARLVLTAEPARDEGMLNYLHRLIALNGFRDLNILNDLLGIISQSAWSHFSLAKRQIDPARVSHLTSLDMSQVESLMYRKSAKLVEFFGTAISPYYFSNIRRVSPTFLRSHGYQKAIWGLRCFSFDPSNMERLVDRCPACGLSLTYRFSAGPCHCAICGWDLRDSLQETVVTADPRAIDFVRHLIDPAQDTSKTWGLPEGLRGLSPAEIFAIIVTLGNLLECEKNGGVEERILTRAKQFDLSPETLVEASLAILGWPDRFLEAASRVRHVKRHIANRVKHPLVLGIPANMRSLKWFLNKEIRKDSGSMKRQIHRFSSADEKVEAINYQFPKPVEADVSSFGLPRAEVVALYRMGAISCPDPKLREQLGVSETAAPRAIDFLEQLPRGSAGLPLSDVVISSKQARHPWAAVLNAALDGRISISQAKSEGFARRFYTKDVAKVRAICLAEETQIDGRTEIGSVDAGFYLSMGYETIVSLKRGGLLPEGKLRLGDVWKFQEDFMSASELRSHLRVMGHRSNNWELWFRIESLGLYRAAPGVSAITRTDGEAFLASCRRKRQVSG
ncbi:hypothetical protein [Rhizobium leguminosarum]|uniref:TniQ protein n=1 Tax=Rhizobium leguminosarum TaxID=384 RepID=A0A7M3DWA2_RHILE|nr:hypothetical protein [Rhizobium leguminosarum]TAY52964.1 hypothetical protein ELH90_15670 [Rhizobium leguminosarum]